MDRNFSINPETKVAVLLDQYPELEEVLINMAPPFIKLKNPLLRKSVAKVTSLRQAAAVGKLSVDQMVNELRAYAGEQPYLSGSSTETSDYFADRPEWFNQDNVVKAIVEAELDPDVMPLKPLILNARKLKRGEIIELVTTYLPAPGIDVMKGKGYSVWSVEEGDIIRSYFLKSK